MSDEPLPPIGESITFMLYGVPVRCAVLVNGQRIVNAEDFDQLMTSLSESEFDRDHPSGDVGAFHAWLYRRT